MMDPKVGIQTEATNLPAEVLLESFVETVVSWHLDPAEVSDNTKLVGKSSMM